MSIESKISLLVQKITHAINSVQSSVGNTSSLPTLDKANLVAALIEIKNEIDALSTAQQNLINDAIIANNKAWSSYKIDQEIVNAIADLIDGAPEWLNSLKELATALQNDPDIITSLSSMIDKRVAVDSVQSFSSVEKTQGRANIDAASQSDLNSVQSVLSGKQNDLGTGSVGTFLSYNRTWQYVTNADVGLGNVTNDKQLKESNLDTDVTLSANSDTKIPSQRAIKYYIDNQTLDGGTF